MSAAACPDDEVAAAIRVALGLVAQAEEAFRDLPDKPAAARNLFGALMDHRALLEERLRIEEDVVTPAFQRGWDLRGLHEARRRLPARHLRVAG